MGLLLLFGSGRLLLILETGIGTSSKFGLELLDAAGSVNELQLARVKRVANIANVDLELFACAACREAVAASAGNLSLEIFRMNSVFHDRSLTNSKGQK